MHALMVRYTMLATMAMIVLPCNAWEVFLVLARRKRFKHGLV